MAEETQRRTSTEVTALQTRLSRAEAGWVEEVAAGRQRAQDLLDRLSQADTEAEATRRALAQSQNEVEALRARCNQAEEAAERATAASWGSGTGTADATQAQTQTEGGDQDGGGGGGGEKYGPRLAELEREVASLRTLAEEERRRAEAAAQEVEEKVEAARRDERARARRAEKEKLNARAKEYTRERRDLEAQLRRYKLAAERAEYKLQGGNGKASGARSGGSSGRRTRGAGGWGSGKAPAPGPGASLGAETPGRGEGDGAGASGSHSPGWEAEGLRVRVAELEAALSSGAPGGRHSGHASPLTRQVESLVRWKEEAEQQMERMRTREEQLLSLWRDGGAGPTVGGGSDGGSRERGGGGGGDLHRQQQQQGEHSGASGADREAHVPSLPLAGRGGASGQGRESSAGLGAPQPGEVARAMFGSGTFSTFSSQQGTDDTGVSTAASSNMTDGSSPRREEEEEGAESPSEPGASGSQTPVASDSAVDSGADGTGGGGGATSHNAQLPSSASTEDDEVEDAARQRGISAREAGWSSDESERVAFMRSLQGVGAIGGDRSGGSAARGSSSRGAESPNTNVTGPIDLSVFPGGLHSAEASHSRDHLLAVTEEVRCTTQRWVQPNALTLLCVPPLPRRTRA